MELKRETSHTMVHRETGSGLLLKVALHLSLVPMLLYFRT